MVTEMQDKGHRCFAAAWDWISIPGERALGRKVRERLLSDLTGRVLEIGVGTGRSFTYFSPDANVTGTEPDPYMLERARKRLHELGKTNIELRQAPAEQLPFEDASFDHAVSTLVLCTVRDLPRALAEARRVLRPEGSFRFYEHVRNDESRFWGKLQDVITPVWRQLGAGCHPNRRTRKAIEDAGFRIDWIEQRRIAPGTPGIYGVARRT